MKITMHAMTIGTFVPVLKNLSSLLDKGVEHAKPKKLDLVNARLAADMFPLSLQTGLACNRAMDSTGRLTGGPPPPVANDEKTIGELQARIRSTVAWLERVKPADFNGAEDRRCVIEPPNADFVIAMSGLELLRDWALPDFYFHIVTAYDILRHNGVQIGKQDYMGWVGAFIRPKT
jgi:hypothetical protein